MPPNRRLTEDVGVFEMNRGAVEVALLNQLSGRRDFVVEQSLVRSIHAGDICNSDATLIPGQT